MSDAFLLLLLKTFN